MKRKVVLRLLSLVMVASMTGTMLPSNIQTASAEEVDVTEKTAALEDGINDAWTQDNKAAIFHSDCVSVCFVILSPCIIDPIF